MADLDPLIRYRKHGVDEKRRVLADLYRQADELAQEKKAVQEEVKRETELAEQDATAESVAYLGRYLQSARRRIDALDKAIRKMETRIIVAQEDMRSAFAEMKKVEITQRNREAREKVKERRKEEQELDEIAIEQYQRREDSD